MLKSIFVLSLTLFLLGSCDFMKKNSKIRTNFLSYERDTQLDPSKLKFIGEYALIDNVTVKLLHMGPNEDYQNDLAEVVKVSDDKVTIYVKIKKASFSDGSIITSEDVAKSFKRGILFGTPHVDAKNLWAGASKLKSLEDDIEGIKVLSDTELELKLTRPTKELFFFLTLTDLAVLHKSQYEKEKILVSDWMKITSGAYKIDYFKDETGKEHLRLIANSKTHNYSKEIPQEVTFESYKGDDVMKRLKDLSLDIGVINFRDYLDNIEAIEKIKGLDIVSNNTDGIAYVGLNAQSGVFEKRENRQWVQKKILESYQIEEKFKFATQKATQFFLPNAKGFIPYASVLNSLKAIDTSKIPEDLKSGFTIKAISGMKYWLPKDIEAKLSSVLGVKVNITFNEDWRNMAKFHTERNYQATVAAYGMSYKVLGEALNLQYLSEAPPLLDPSGKIKKLIAKYQTKDAKEDEAKVIEQILEQMVKDSECVPLFYYSSPYFVKSETLDAKNIHLDESIKFYKMVVK